MKISGQIHDAPPLCCSFESRGSYQLKHQSVCLGHFHFTLKYFGSTLCLSAWALPTDFSAEAMASASSRFSTSVLMVVMTRWACFLSWTLRCISSGSSMSLKSLKSCLDEGKLTNNLQKNPGSLVREDRIQLLRWSRDLHRRQAGVHFLLVHKY